MLLAQPSQHRVILRTADPRKCIEINKTDHIKNCAYLNFVKDGQCSRARGTLSLLSSLEEKNRHDSRSQCRVRVCVSHPSFESTIFTRFNMDVSLYHPNLYLLSYITLSRLNNMAESPNLEVWERYESPEMMYGNVSWKNIEFLLKYFCRTENMATVRHFNLSFSSTVINRQLELRM